jgi:hypothetical protein
LLPLTPLGFILELWSFQDFIYKKPELIFPNTSKFNQCRKNLRLNNTKVNKPLQIYNCKEFYFDMRVGVGYSNFQDITLAANSVVQQAVKMSGRNDLCDMALLFCTSNHNQQLLRQAVTEALGGDVPIYGGGAAGVITNDNYGYAGEQVGIACIWLEGVSYDVFIGKDLSAGNEAELGRKLGKMAVQAGVDTKSSYLLFYDAVDNRKAGDTRLNMATWILEGLQEEFGFAPNLVGAGIIGNHQFDAAGQFIGSKADKNCAIMITFSEDVQITSTILHGCRPASEYYTVTKADGPVILEI